MAGERGTNTQTSCMVTIKILTYEEESLDEWLKVCPCHLREVDRVVTVGRMLQHTDKHEVGAEGKSQPGVLLGFWWSKSSTRK